VFTLLSTKPDPSDCESHSHPPTPGMTRAYRQLLDEVDAPSLAEQDRSWLDEVIAYFMLCAAAVSLCFVLVGCPATPVVQAPPQAQQLCCSNPGGCVATLQDGSCPSGKVLHNCDDVETCNEDESACWLDCKLAEQAD